MTDDSEDDEAHNTSKKHKLGHLRVDTQGNATFKRLPTNQLVEALQLGIQYSVGGLEARPAHDVLYQDFVTVEIINFPKGGRNTPKATPPHRFNDFTIRSYAPVAFRHFREKFNIKPEDYLSSICRPFRELKNPGASGSLFYLTSDDEFIIKTVQKKEAAFLKTLLPGYYMNVTQNQRTLLPKFFGLYCYQVTEFLPRHKNGSGENKNIRITVMNNLIPSHIQMHEKYDLKGSTYKRRANSEERLKESPTWKDLDFMERHPDGLILDSETHNALEKTVQRDCRVLESFHIMDYSFLIGVHHANSHTDSPREHPVTNGVSNNSTLAPPSLRRMYSTPMASIQAEFGDHNKPDDDHLAKTGGIPALTADGQRLYLYVGIIDILQSYQLRKKIEHRFKSVITDGSQISVTRPSYYSERFQKFLFHTVFKKALPRQSKPDVMTGSRQTINNNLYTNPPTNNTPSIKSLNGIPYTIPSRLIYSTSSSSAGTTNSRLTMNGTPIRSSKQSEQRNIHGSSTTFYASSQQSDSLFNEPIHRSSGRVLTTRLDTNHTDNSRMKFYRDLSTPPIIDVEKRHSLLAKNGNVGKKITSSTTNISQRNNLLEYSKKHHQQNHQSSEEITRL